MRLISCEAAAAASISARTSPARCAAMSPSVSCSRTRRLRDPAAGDRPEARVLRARPVLDHVRRLDPLDYVKGAQKRFALFHVKDGVPNQSQDPDPGFTDLGKGEVNFKRVFKALKDKDAHHYLLERDTQPNPERTVRSGYRYMAGMRGKRKGGHRH